MTKFYTPLHQSSPNVVQKIFSLVHTRPAGLCNFLDAPELEAFLGNKDEVGGRWQVVYRNYATLFFVFVVDGAESELGILDLIQVRRGFGLVSFLLMNCSVTMFYRSSWRVLIAHLRTSASWTSCSISMKYTEIWRSSHID